MDGRKALTFCIAKDPSRKQSPSVTLTTSKADEGMEKNYRPQANCHVGKTADLRRVRENDENTEAISG